MSRLLKKNKKFKKGTVRKVFFFKNPKKKTEFIPCSCQNRISSENEKNK
jgi:hypothetical protein